MLLRRFLNVSKEHQRSLTSQFQSSFDALDNWYDTGILTGIELVSISIFDHWLSQDEARLHLGDVDEVTQFENNKKLHKFVCSLTSQFDSYLVKFKGRRHNRVSFRKFTSNSAREKTLTLQHSEAGNQCRFVLAIPELDALYFEGWDFTHHIYSPNKFEMSKIEPLFDVCKVHPLYEPLNLDSKEQR